VNRGLINLICAHALFDAEHRHGEVIDDSRMGASWLILKNNGV
jgi:hypothetical protein